MNSNDFTNIATPLVLNFDRISIMGDVYQVWDKKLSKYGVVSKSGKEIIPCIYNYINECDGDFVEGYARIKSSSKWGFINSFEKHKITIPFDYDYVTDFHNGLARVIKNGEAGFIDVEGNETIPCNNISDFNLKFPHHTLDTFFNSQCSDCDGLWIGRKIWDRSVSYRDGGKIESYKTEDHLIDAKGKVLAIYDSIYSCHEGMMGVRKGDKFGYINKEGKEVIQCIYDEAYGFHEGLALVVINDKCGFIDKIGKMIIPCIYEDYSFVYQGYGRNMTPFDGGIAAVCKNRKFGLVDKTGREVVSCVYDDYENTRKYVELHTRYEEYRFDKKSQKLFKRREYFQNLNSTITQVQEIELADGTYGLEQDGKILKGRAYKKIGYIYSSTKYVSITGINDKIGFIDTMSGEEVIPCIYDGIDRNRDDLDGKDVIIVHKGGKMGVVYSGKETIPCIYDNIDYFGNDGFARVRQGTNYGAIDKTGARCIPCNYNEVSEIKNGMAVVRIGAKYGVVDFNDKEIIPCIYDHIRIEQNGFFYVCKDSYNIIIDESNNVLVACRV